MTPRGHAATSTRRLVLLALAGWLFGVPATAAAGEIVIEIDALKPSALSVALDEPVAFVNRSGRLVHVEFAGPDDGHRVWQVPGRIRAIFHRPGRHPYVVHFESGPRRELRGVVEVQASPAPRPGDPTCRGLTVEETCIER